MAYCGKVKDVEKACDAIPLNLKASMYAVRLEALSVTKSPTNPFLLTKIEVIDPATGAYPLAASEFYPVKIEWLYNSVLQNTEPLEGTSLADSFVQTIGPVIITDSESAEGKANAKALNTNMYAIVAPVKGVADADDTFHVYGVQNGLKFTIQASAVEFGNRTVGNFRSIAGGEEATPNGVNWLDTTYAKTLAQFNNRLEEVVIP